MESVLKGCPVVGNVCVYGDSSKSYVVAVICPVPATLKEIADKFGKADMGFEAQCKDKDVTGAVLREVSAGAKKALYKVYFFQVVNHAKNSKLEKFEIPGAVTLTHIEWTPVRTFHLLSRNYYYYF